jgi:hypothetical protein
VFEQEQHEEGDYDYYGSYYDQPHRQHSPEGGHKAAGVKAFSQDLKSLRWPLNFKPLGIEKYDGSTNPAEWLEVFQLAIEAAGGDSYVMANYLSVCLSPSIRTWLLGLLVGSVHSWSHLCQLFTSNFRATCARLGVDWDLASLVHKKEESLWEFIQHFCNRRNTISEVDNKCIIMFFKMVLRDPTLIRKLAMKNPGRQKQCSPSLVGTP